MKISFNKKVVTLSVIALFSAYPIIASTAPSMPFSNIFVDRGLLGFPKLENPDQGVFQLFSHGRPGELLIDGQWLKKEAIATFLRPKLTTVIKHINIYGCEFAKAAIGLDAVRYLEKELNITISASTDVTGGKYADWVLEYGGQKSTMVVPDYNGTLQNIVTDGGFANFPATPSGPLAPASTARWYMAQVYAPWGYTYLDKQFNLYNDNDAGSTGNTQRNSTLTGGLFDELEGPNANPTSGLMAPLNEADYDDGGIVYDLKGDLKCGTVYKYSFDLTHGYGQALASQGIVKVFLWDKVTKTTYLKIVRTKMKTLPGGASNPSYKNFSGTFTLPTEPKIGDDLLLVFGLFNGGACIDFMLDRVAIAPQTPCSLLPLTWITVDGNSKNGNPEITWETGTEVNVDHYVVQRSINGQDFNTAGTVDAYGNGFNGNTYSFVDHRTASLNTSRLFYRILSIDKDGKTSMSKTISISSRSSSMNIKLSPNPTRGKIYFSALDEIGSIEIFNLNGTMVKQFGNVRPTQLNYDISDLSNGLYIVKLTDRQQGTIFMKINLTR